jgi:hypothetical protein
LQRTPFPYALPLPEAIPAAIDGTYAKINQSWPQWWRCLRCADYRLAGGIWRLQFDRGVLRIFYDVTGWRSIASFTVSGDRLSIFNDPYCPETTGDYTWGLVDGELRLEALNDACSFGLRAKNLSAQAWPACEPHAQAIAAGEQLLAGCADNPNAATSEASSESPVQVVVHSGESHHFAKPPDVFADANSADIPPPAGIQVVLDDASIPFGTYRVLWWNGDWIQATTDLPFSSIGVQFWGARQIGWARVLFDDVEVWRGITSALGEKSGFHGGYIEVTGFRPGRHTIRVESLGFDYRPVTVTDFGFSDERVHSRAR